MANKLSVEEYIKVYTRNCSNQTVYSETEICREYHPWLTPDHARAVAKIAKEEVIEDACRWFEGYAFIPSYCVDDFKKAMSKRYGV